MSACTQSLQDDHNAMSARAKSPLHAPQARRGSQDPPERQRAVGTRYTLSGEK